MTTEITGTIVPAGTPLTRDDNPADDRAVQLAREWLVTRKSPNTRASYGRDVGVPVLAAREPSGGRSRTPRAPSWLQWCAVTGIGPLGASETHLAVWARGMEAAGLSSPSIARKLAAVSSWYKWLVRNGHAAVNPAAALPRPDVDHHTSKTPGLTREQALAILAAAAAEIDQPRARQPLRTVALAYLFLYTGARVSEITEADVGDIGMDRGHQVLWVTRKGGKQQPLVLLPQVIVPLNAYLAARDDLTHLPALVGDTGGLSRPLIVTASGKRMDPRDVWILIRRLGRAAKLPAELVRRMGPHSMRHTFATLYLDAGGNLRDLQDAMGHADPGTTRVYDDSRLVLDRSPGYRLGLYLAPGGESLAGQ